MRTFYAYLLPLFLICSCSPTIPDPTPYPYSQQQKMQASSHWEVLATDLANRINNELILTDNIYKAVFVKETCGDETISCKPNETSSFNEAFRDLLITNLFRFGIPTKSQSAVDTIEVQYKVQVVHHIGDRVLSLQSAMLTSHYEIIITTSMQTNERYLFRASNIYYINDKDFHHYQESLPQTKTIILSNTKPLEQINRPEFLPIVISPTPYLDSSNNLVEKTEL